MTGPNRFTAEEENEIRSAGFAERHNRIYAAQQRLTMAAAAFGELAPKDIAWLFELLDTVQGEAAKRATQTLLEAVAYATALRKGEP